MTSSNDLERGYMEGDMIVTTLDGVAVPMVWVGQSFVWTNETGVMASRERLLTYKTVLDVKVRERDRADVRVRAVTGPPVATVDVATAYGPMVIRTELWRVWGVVTIVGIRLVTDEWEVIGECPVAVRVRGLRVVGLVFERRRGGELQGRTIRHGEGGR